MIAAIYVLKNGPYYGIPDVDPWDQSRDARLYGGPYPVVAHPPCARWGRFWSGAACASNRSRETSQRIADSHKGSRVRFKLGDDGGCFEAALTAVRQWGGVLEHPEASHPWPAFGLAKPPRNGGWVSAALWDDGWTCCVEQGHYGHRARKATWLYAVGCELPDLKWGDCGIRPDQTDPRAVKIGICQRLSKRQRAATPEPFRDILLNMARSVNLAHNPL